MASSQQRGGEGLRRRGGGNDNGLGDSDSKARKPRITLESFDLYQKVQAEEVVQTTSGATVSVVSLIVIGILLLSELSGFFFPRRSEHMAVDTVIEGKLRVNFDITLHALTCAEANLDAMDVAGEQQNGLDHDIVKIRLDGNTGLPVGDAIAGRIGGDANASDDHATGGGGGVGVAVPEPTPLPQDYCGSCYGVPGKPCCNTCDELRAAYTEHGWDSTDIVRESEQCKRELKNPSLRSQPGEGCRLQGFMMVNKVAGNFHIAMGETHARGAGHIHQFNPATIAKFNVTHTINSLSFGLPYPGQHNALDASPMKVPPEGAGVYMYFIKVIPTVYRRQGANLTTNQYSITTQYRPAIINGQRQNVLPGLFFVYDISPFMVTVTESSTPFAQVVTSLFAILGGVITAATLIDTVLYTLGKTLKGGGGNGGIGGVNGSGGAHTNGSGSSGTEGGVAGGLVSSVEALLSSNPSQIGQALVSAVGSMQKSAGSTAAHTFSGIGSVVASTAVGSPMMGMMGTTSSMGSSPVTPMMYSGHASSSSSSSSSSPMNSSSSGNYASSSPPIAYQQQQQPQQQQYTASPLQARNIPPHASFSAKNA